MKINRSRLSFWVDIIGSQLPNSKSALNIHKAIVIQPTEDGKSIHLRANSDIHAFDVGPIEAVDPFAVAIDAASLKHALGTAGEWVEFEDLSDIVKISIGETQFDLNRENIDAFVFPDTEGPYNDLNSLTRKALLTMLNQAQPFLGKDATQPYLMGVLFVDKFIYATDLLQAVRFDTGVQIADEPINFIPETVIAFLNAGGRDESPVSISLNDNWVLIACGPFRVYSRRFATRGEYQYPRIDEEIDKCKLLTAFVELEVKSLREGIERVSFFAETKIVRIIAQQANIRIEAFRGKRVIAKAKLVGVSNLAQPIEYLLALDHLDRLSKTEADRIRFQVGKSSDHWFIPSENSFCFTSTAEAIDN